jgi:hypothetical protein
MKIRSTRWCVGFIFLSMVFSSILALTVNWDHNEPGMFYNMFLPPLAGILPILFISYS